MVEDADFFLQPTVQKDQNIAMLESVTAGQQKLLKEINEQFNAEDSLTDLAILYEVTGFKDEDDERLQFW